MSLVNLSYQGIACSHNVICLIIQSLNGKIQQEGSAQLENWKNADPGNRILFNELANKSYQKAALCKLLSYDVEGSLARIKRHMGAPHMIFNIWRIMVRCIA